MQSHTTFAGFARAFRHNTLEMFQPGKAEADMVMMLWVISQHTALFSRVCRLMLVDSLFLRDLWRLVNEHDADLKAAPDWQETAFRRALESARGRIET